MRTKPKGSLLMALGLIMVLAAICITAWNFHSEKKAAASAQLALEVLRADIPESESASRPQYGYDGSSGQLIEKEEVEIPDYILNPEMEMPERSINGWDYIGILEIPALELELPVISSWSYPALNVSPCRYSGSAYTGNFIIAAHNFPSHFGSLKDLPDGSAVFFTDMDGNRFEYAVVLTETLQPTAVEEMKSGDWALSLFTCTVGGQYRVTVRCDLVEN